MSLHASIDLETVDTRPSAIILSIGISIFDIESGAIIDNFYATPDTAEQLRTGRSLSADTLRWWMQQEAGARQVLAASQQPVVDVLAELDAFLMGGNLGGVWGNGADFDCVILGDLYETFGRKKPWSYSKNRCLRTLRALQHPKEIVMPQRVGTHHNALDDAIHQAKLIHAITKAHNLTF